MNRAAQFSIGNGEIQNHLGWLTKDRSSFLPGRFLSETHLTPSAASRDLEIQRPKMYAEEIPLKPSTKFRERILSIVMVTDVAFELFGKNHPETLNWLMAPNVLLFGASPFEVCLRGDGNILLKWLLERAGVKPGIT